MLSIKDSRSGQTLILVIILITIAGAIMMVGGFNLPEQEQLGKPWPRTIVTDTPQPDKLKNLQLQTFKFKDVCGADDGACHPIDTGACCTDAQVYCRAGRCVGVWTGTPDSVPQGSLPTPTFAACQYLDNVCDQACGNDEGFTCYGKPVILLYPKTRTNVDVKIVTSGEITVSDPLYPPDGWKNVTAEPNGQLSYQGKIYHELFYESEVKYNNPPAQGIIIPKSQLKEKLTEFTYQLGLEPAEQPEFLDFWIPKLEKLNSNYILFSVVDKQTKEINDHVEISPEPDTRIEFIAYFKPLDIPIAIEPLKLSTRPQRTGFTMVEWGGTIDE